MRNWLALIAAALLIFLGLGWYLDWYRLKTTPGDDGHRQINIDLNTNKITEDVNKGREKVSGWWTPKDQGQNGGNPNPNGQTVTPGRPTSFQPNNGEKTPTPTPPSGGPRLPTPQ